MSNQIDPLIQNKVIFDSDISLEDKYVQVLNSLRLPLTEMQNIAFKISDFLFKFVKDDVENEKFNNSREAIKASKDYVNKKIDLAELTRKRYAAEADLSEADDKAYLVHNLTFSTTDIADAFAIRLAVITTYAAENIAYAGSETIEEIVSAIVAVTMQFNKNIEESFSHIGVDYANSKFNLRELLFEYLKQIVFLSSR